MSKSSTHIDKSRLGRLLVNRGYITEEQLEAALAVQRTTQQKLGEILIEQGLVTQRELDRTLKHQSRYRYAAAFVAMVVTPLQPLVAFAAPSLPAPTGTRVEAFEIGGGLQPLDEVELSSVSAQGLMDDVQVFYDLMKEQDNPDTVDALKSLARILMPVWQVLDTDLTIEGVYYDASRSKVVLTPDGGFNVPLPTRIEQVRIDNIRVAGSVGPSFGNIVMENIQFSDSASLVVRAN